jgi:hypothetical protein
MHCYGVTTLDRRVAMFFTKVDARDTTSIYRNCQMAV